MSYHTPKPPTEAELAWLKTLEIDTIAGRIFQTGVELGFRDPGNDYWKVIVPPSISGRHLKRANIVWWRATGKWPTQMLDHKNTIRWDDAYDNLELTNNSKNAINTQGGRQSKYGLPKGITYNPIKSNKTKDYVATLVRGGKKRFLGRFATPEEALEVYTKARGIYDNS